MVSDEEEDNKIKDTSPEDKKEVDDTSDDEVNEPEDAKEEDSSGSVEDQDTANQSRGSSDKDSSVLHDDKSKYQSAKDEHDVEDEKQHRSNDEEKSSDEDAEDTPDESEDKESSTMSDATGVDPKVLAALDEKGRAGVQPAQQVGKENPIPAQPQSPMDILQQAQGQADKQHQSAQILRAFQQALQAASRNNMKADNGVANAMDANANNLEARAKEKVALQAQLTKQQRDDQLFQLQLSKANLDFQNDKLTQDPNSPESQIAQQRVIQKQQDMGQPVNPAQIKTLSAYQLYRIMPYLQKDLTQYYQNQQMQQKLQAQKENTKAIIAGRQNVADQNNQTKQDIAELKAQQAKDAADKKVTDINNKDALELSNFLDKGWAARGGQAGVVQNKINSAEAAEKLIEQGKTQQGGLDSRQMEELAQSVSRLLGGGQQASARIDALVPKTLLGRAQTFNEWLSNSPKGAEQQAFVQRLAETVQREKDLAMQQKKEFQVGGLSARARLKQNNGDLYSQILKDHGLTDEDLKPAANGAPTAAASPGSTPKTSVGPYGDTTVRNGKTYKWNPAVNKYQLLNNPTGQ